MYKEVARGAKVVKEVVFGILSLVIKGAQNILRKFFLDNFNSQTTFKIITKDLLKKKNKLLLTYLYQS